MLSDNYLKAIIVEDERTSRDYLTQLLAARFPEISVVAMETTVQPAIAAIMKHEPDIVFLDVEIKMGTGFDVLNGLKSLDFGVIFTTAFNQFAIDAFQYNAVDYLLKPLDGEKVVRAIHRCIERHTAQKSNKELLGLLQYLRRPVQQRFPVATMHGIEFIDMNDILYAEADGSYCKLKLRSGRIITMTKRIKDLEEQLTEPQFMRIHHSYLVNTGCVKMYHKGRGGHIILDDNSSLPVSSSRKDDFLRLFNQRL